VVFVCVFSSFVCLFVNNCLCVWFVYDECGFFVCVVYICACGIVVFPMPVWCMCVCCWCVF